MNFDCKKCKTFDVCEMTKELGFMNGGCRAYTEKKPQTNADKIRSLSDYDLADWIAQVLMYHGSFSRRPLTIDDNECPRECPLYKCCNDQPSDNIEDWLKAPADLEVGK